MPNMTLTNPLFRSSLGRASRPAWTLALLPLLLWGCEGASLPEAVAVLETATPVVGQPVLLDGTDSRDPAGAPLDFAWRLTRAPAGSAAKMDLAQSPRARFVPDALGQYGVALVVSNGTLTSAQAELTISVQCASPEISVAIEADPAEQGPVGRPVALTALLTRAEVPAGCAVDETVTINWTLDQLPSGSRASLDAPTGPKPQFTPDKPGTYLVSLSATDALGRVSRDTLQWRASCGDAAPVIDAITQSPEGPARVGQPVGLVASATDPDADPACGLPQDLSYAWEIAALPVGSASTLSAVDRRTVSLTPDAPGRYVLDLTVTDPQGHAARQRHDVEVCGASPPTVSAITFGPEAAVGQPLGLSAEVQDADIEGCGGGERFEFSWRLVGLPSGSGADIQGPALARPFFVPDLPGAYAVEVVVTDLLGLTGRAVAEIEISACGAGAPSAQIAASPATPIIGDAVRLIPTLEDPDTAEGCGLTESLSTTWALLESPSGFDPTLARLELREPWFLATHAGRYVFRLVVTDAAGHRSAPTAIAVEVSACGGAAPVIEAITAAPEAPRVGQAGAASARISDADNAEGCDLDQRATLLWALVARPQGSQASLDDPRRSSPRFAADVPGQFVLQAVATDDTGLRSAPLEVVITAAGCGGAAPTVDAVEANPDQPLVGQRVTLRAQASDADAGEGCALDQAIALAWRFIELPPGSRALLQNADTGAPWFEADAAGVYRAVVVATDDTARDSAPQEIAVLVTDCGDTAPTILSASTFDDPVDVLEPVSLFVDFTDADEGCGAPPQSPTPLWRLVAQPEGSRAALDLPGSATPSFTPDLPGIYRLEVTVADAGGLTSAPRSVVLEATACGAQAPVALLERTAPAPTLGPGGNLEIEARACAGADFLQLDARASFDDDNRQCGYSQALFYDWQVLEFAPGGTLVARTPDRRNPTFSVDAGGRYTVALRVTDDAGLQSDPALISLNVTAIPPPQVARVTPPLFCGEAVTVTVTGENFVEFDGVAPTVILGDEALAIDRLLNCQIFRQAPLVRRCTALEVTVPSDFPADVYDLRVQNPFPVGCTSPSSAVLVVAGSPEIDDVEPDPICRGQFTGDLVLTGNGFFEDGNRNLRPTVRVNGALAVVQAIDGCREIGGNLRVCRQLRVRLPPSERDESILDLSVLNPAPADCEEARFRLIQSEPPDIQDVQPRKICDLGGSLFLTGQSFEAGMTVDLGLDRADEVRINGQGTIAEAVWSRGDEPRLTPGLFTLRATNPSGCFDEFPEQIRVTTGPFVFFVDPPVAFNGITIQATVYLGNLFGGNINRAVLTDSDGDDLDLAFSFDPLRPNRIQVVVPEGLDPDTYDVTLYDDVDCPGTTLDLLRVTDDLSVQITALNPLFGWSEEATGVTAEANPLSGFVSTPRVYLNPSPGDECAIDEECGPGQGCSRGLCLGTCQDIIDCGPGEACLDGLCAAQATELRAVGILDASELQGIIDAGQRPGLYDLIAVNPDGSVGLLERAFTVTVEPPPLVDAVSPGSWETNNNALPVTIQGRNLRVAAVSAECLSPNGGLLVPAITLGNRSATSASITVNTSTLAHLSVCALKVTNDDGSFEEFSPVTVTNPAGNFVGFNAGPLLGQARRAPAVFSGAPSRRARFIYTIGGDGGAPASALASGEFSALNKFGTPGPWRPLPLSLPSGRTLAKAERINDFVYLPGGFDAGIGGPTGQVLRARVLNPLEVPVINNVDFEFDEEGQGLATGVYYYRVAAVMNGFHPANPGGEELTSDPQPIFVPNIEQGVTSIIEWTAVPGAASYRIYRNEDPDEPLGNERLLAVVPADARLLRDDGQATPNDELPLPLGALGVWHPIATLVTPRLDHGVAVAPNPVDPALFHLIVAGGSNGQSPLNSIEIVTLRVGGPGDQTVTSVQRLANAFPGARAGLEILVATPDNASLLPPQRAVLYILGGLGEREQTDVFFAPILASGLPAALSTTEALRPFRSGYAAAVASNALVTVGGQGNGPSSTGASSELFNSTGALDNWNSLGNTDFTARFQAGRTSFSGFFYVVGGTTDQALASRSMDFSILGGTP